MSMAFYRPSKGHFDRIHPISKIIALMLAFVPPFMAQSPFEVLAYLLLLFLVALAIGAWSNLRRMGFIMGILFIMSVFLWTFFQEGSTPLLRIEPVTIYREAFLYGVKIGLRLNCFVLAAVIFLTVTRIEDFTYGLSRLGLPFVVSFALSLSFRLTPLFMETGQTIVMAQRARGLDLSSGGPLNRLRHYVPIIVPILVSGLRRSDQLAVALESKGFGGKCKRSCLVEYEITWRDFVLIVALLLVCLAMGINFWFFNK